MATPRLRSVNELYAVSMFNSQLTSSTFSNARCRSLGKDNYHNRSVQPLPRQHAVHPNRRDAVQRLLFLQLTSALSEMRLAQHAQAQVDSNILEQQYDGYAASYDDLDAGPLANLLGFPTLRTELLEHAQGDVLEVAVGTGINLPYYLPQQLTSLTAIDLSAGMLKQAQAAAQTLPWSETLLKFQQADVTKLPFESDTFDTIVDTFSLCVFPDPEAALCEIARVVRPGGKVLLLEHSRSQVPGVGSYQDLTADAVAASGKGCVWNQDVVKLLAKAGLKTVDVHQHLGGLISSLQAVRADR